MKLVEGELEKSSNIDIAELLSRPPLDELNQEGFIWRYKDVEHLNRALVVERELADKRS